MNSLISWNVNGLRSILKKNVLEPLIKQYKPDIICLNETKLTYDIEINLGYKYIYFNNSLSKKGYSGTCILSNIEPLSFIKGFIYDDELDNEGRIITLEFESYYLINVYVPNAGSNRLIYKINIWNINFMKHIKILKKKKNVLLCGDFNVAHKEIDIARPKQNIYNAGYTIEERTSFNNLLKKCKLYDAYRVSYPNKIEYTFWDSKSKARERNVGWRIDYILLDNNINKPYKILILGHILGSDHSPIYFKYI